MKIKNIIVAALSIVVLTSCGEAVKETTLCSCTELSLEGFKEVGMDQEKMKAFEEKNKEELAKCEELGNTLNDEMQEMSAEEQEAKRQEYMDECPAMQELQDLIMEQMQNAYQDMDMGDAMEGLEESFEGLEEGMENVGENLEETVNGLEEMIDEKLK